MNYVILFNNNLPNNEINLNLINNNESTLITDLDSVKETSINKIIEKNSIFLTQHSLHNKCYTIEKEHSFSIPLSESILFNEQKSLVNPDKKEVINNQQQRENLIQHK